uniref:Uncharacterized protein n=1 Tax=Anguilla anguilla TaxID=7936 RepID=A0A0E9PUV2_ANGAN
MGGWGGLNVISRKSTLPFKLQDPEMHVLAIRGT